VRGNSAGNYSLGCIHRQKRDEQQAEWNDEPGAAPLRSSVTQVTQLLGIAALRVSPRHRHSLTLSAPMPNTLIACVIYVHFCTSVSHCIASDYTCIDYLIFWWRKFQYCLHYILCSMWVLMHSLTLPVLITTMQRFAW
jgi:hypothetical protein